MFLVYIVSLGQNSTGYSSGQDKTVTATFYDSLFVPIGGNENPRSDVIGWSRGKIGWQKMERDSCLLWNLADILNR